MDNTPQEGIAGKSLDFLVVDDEPSLRDIIESMLPLFYQGCEVRKGKDGESLVRLAEEKKPDLIVSDYRMPNLDGFSAVQGIVYDI